MHFGGSFGFVTGAEVLLILVILTGSLGNCNSPHQKETGVTPVGTFVVITIVRTLLECLSNCTKQ
jgi:hypothetical protein